MFILDPDQYLKPFYRISPFKTADVAINHNLPDDNLIGEYFSDRFKEKEYQYTINGREAIHLALNYYSLQREDVVTILTTSGNSYISSCVTNEIEKFCRWSRKIQTSTKVLLVNHEFGFPFEGLNELKELEIPIIEDCAHSFFSQDRENTIGNTGDFAIYSFPKMFPLQIGGLLVSNINELYQNEKRISIEELRYVKNVLSHYINNKDKIIGDRISNYNYLKDRFSQLGCSVRFHSDAGMVPGVFIFKIEDKSIDLPKLKQYFWNHGVQCSVFYGEIAFFIPCHQNLNEDDLNYFVEVFKSALFFNNESCS